MQKLKRAISIALTLSMPPIIGYAQTVHHTGALDYRMIFVACDSMLTTDEADNDAAFVDLIYQDPPQGYYMDPDSRWQAGDCHKNGTSGHAIYTGYGQLGSAGDNVAGWNTREVSGTDPIYPWLGDVYPCNFLDEIMASEAGWVIVHAGYNDYTGILNVIDVYDRAIEFIERMVNGGRRVVFVSQPPSAYWNNTSRLFNEPFGFDDDDEAPAPSVNQTTREANRNRNMHWVFNKIEDYAATHNDVYFIDFLDDIITNPEFSGWDGTGTPGAGGQPSWADISESISRTWNDMHCPPDTPHHHYASGAAIIYDYVMDQLNSILDDGTIDVCDNDTDCDGILNDHDTCPAIPNGPALGTCVRHVGGIFIGTGVACTDNSTCGSGQTCQMDQEDINGNDIGDVCECYADCNRDGKVNTTDLGIMKIEFFRTDCATIPCQADINDDDKVNISDLGIMKVQFFKTGCRYRETKDLIN